MQPVMQYVGEKAIEELTLHVYYKNGKAESVHYDDGGEGYGYQEGQRTVRRFTVTGSATDLVLTQAIEGDYPPSYATYRVVLHGVAGAIAVTADGQPAPVTEATLETGLTLPSLVVPVGFGEVRVNVVPAGAGKGRTCWVRVSRQREHGKIVFWRVVFGNKALSFGYSFHHIFTTMKKGITGPLSLALLGGAVALWGCEKVAPAELSPKAAAAVQLSPGLIHSPPN